MAHHHSTICLLSPHEAEQLAAGDQHLNHFRHQHISSLEARFLVNGTQNPNLAAADSGVKVQERWRPYARWALLSNGNESAHHLVLERAWSWQVIRGSWQFALLGRTVPRKHGKTHIRGPRAERRGRVIRPGTLCRASMLRKREDPISGSGVIEF